MFRDIVKELLEDCLEQRQDLFLIDFEILEGNKIRIIIDGDKGVLVEDCMFVSRGIEHNIDRDEHDFALEVSSSGATTPLTHPRQYQKHIGRTLEVRTADNQKFEATLTAANAQDIVLNWKAREPKPIGKGKVTVQKSATLLYNDINEAKVKIIF
ncbi:MAG: ribosome assembly cofactor RimP [Flavobacteriaceae bacterium]|nr:ribosome assembly cofactor RimP [Flavobacteriaceae bacterium]